MNINDAYPSKYLKASDLQGRNITVKMGRVDMEAINGEKKLILYFQNKEKGMVLNKTNANNIAGIYGGETEEWYGKPITMVEAMVDYQGQSVPAIRLRKPRQDKAPRQQARREENFDDAPRDQISSGRNNYAEATGRPDPRSDMDQDIPF